MIKEARCINMTKECRNKCTKVRIFRAKENLSEKPSFGLQINSGKYYTILH